MYKLIDTVVVIKYPHIYIYIYIYTYIHTYIHTHTHTHTYIYIYNTKSLQISDTNITGHRYYMLCGNHTGNDVIRNMKLH